MPNNIEKAKIFQQEMDDKLTPLLTSAWMESNASDVIWSGGNEIKILSYTMSGLGKYDKSLGYTKGSINAAYQTHVFDMDRSVSFTLDRNDVDETNFALSAGKLADDTQRQEIAPEVDAYRYSKLFKVANDKLKSRNYIASTADVVAELKNDIAEIQDVVGETEPLVIVMSVKTSSVLDQADKIEKVINVTEFNMGQVNTKVSSIDNIPIIKVPSIRFKTDYSFKDEDGFEPTDTAMDMNWLILPLNYVIGIIKTSSVKILDPDTYQDGDAWFVAFRKYHTCIIPDNKTEAMFANYKSTVAPLLTATVAVGAVNGNTKFTATAGSGNVLGYTVTAVADKGYFNTIPTITKPYTSGADIPAVAGQFLNMYEVNSVGRVVKFNSVELAASDIKS